MSRSRLARRLLVLAACLAASLAAVAVFAPTRPALAQEDAELTPREILDKSLDQNGLGITAGLATVTLTVDDGKGKVDVKELRIESENGEDDESARSRITLLAPSDMAGEAYLFLANTEREDDVYMHLPAFKETRKVSGSDKTGSFLGTHLTYRDLETRDLEDGEARRLPDEAIGPHDCYVIESTPPADDDSQYGRVVTWVRKKDFMPLRVEFYDKRDKLDKRMFSEKISKQDGTRYVKKMSIQPAAGGSTTMEITEIDFSPSFGARTFSKDALGQ